MKTVGLTGGIACGKSTVARLLRERGVPVVDADQASRTIVESGRPALTELVSAFGEGVLRPDGTLDRKALGALVMGPTEAHRERRRVLEAITHPRIAAEVAAQLQAHARQGAAVAAVEAALMVETGSYRQHAALLVVTCAPHVQLRRLCAREGLSEADARRWIETQMPLSQKEAVADAIIHNSDGIEALQEATDLAWTQICSQIGLNEHG